MLPFPSQDNTNILVLRLVAGWTEKPCRHKKKKKNVEFQISTKCVLPTEFSAFSRRLREAIIPFCAAPVLRSLGILRIILGTSIWKDTLGIWKEFSGNQKEGVMRTESCGKTEMIKYAAQIPAGQRQRMDVTVL